MLRFLTHPDPPLLRPGDPGWTTNSPESGSASSGGPP